MAGPSNRFGTVGECSAEDNAGDGRMTGLINGDGEITGDEKMSRSDGEAVGTGGYTAALGSAEVSAMVMMPANRMGC